jgi:hypothetical protein
LQRQAWLTTGYQGRTTFLCFQFFPRRFGRGREWQSAAIDSRFKLPMQTK